MHIRFATTRDLHRLANITVTSLPDDPTFDWMWPHRREYPEDNFFFWQFRLQSLLCDKKFVFIVMVLDDDDEDAGLASRIDAPPGTIISYGIWGRFGKSKAAKKRWKAKNTLLNIVDTVTTKLEEYSLSCKYKRRDADFDRLKALEDNIAAIDKEVFSDAVDKWSMELLVTDVKYRRRGAATALVKWGTQKADEEGVPCRVEASPMGRPVYRSCGFVDIKPWKVTARGQDETLEFWVMRREPNHQAANSFV